MGGGLRPQHRAARSHVLRGRSHHHPVHRASRRLTRACRPVADSRVHSALRAHSVGAVPWEHRPDHPPVDRRRLSRRRTGPGDNRWHPLGGGRPVQAVSGGARALAAVPACLQGGRGRSRDRRRGNGGRCRHLRCRRTREVLRLSAQRAEPAGCVRRWARPRGHVDHPSPPALTASRTLGQPADSGLGCAHGSGRRLCLLRGRDPPGPDGGVFRDDARPAHHARAVDVELRYLPVLPARGPGLSRRGPPDEVAAGRRAGAGFAAALPPARRDAGDSDAVATRCRRRDTGCGPGGAVVRVDTAGRVPDVARRLSPVSPAPGTRPAAGHRPGARCRPGAVRHTGDSPAQRGKYTPDVVE